MLYQITRHLDVRSQRSLFLTSAAMYCKWNIQISDDDYERRFLRWGVEFLTQHCRTSPIGLDECGFTANFGSGGSRADIYCQEPKNFLLAIGSNIPDGTPGITCQRTREGILMHEDHWLRMETGASRPAATEDMHQLWLTRNEWLCRWAGTVLTQEQLEHRLTGSPDITHCTLHMKTTHCLHPKEED